MDFICHMTSITICSEAWRKNFGISLALGATSLLYFGYLSFLIINYYNAYYFFPPFYEHIFMTCIEVIVHGLASSTFKSET